MVCGWVCDKGVLGEWVSGVWRCGWYSVVWMVCGCVGGFVDDV